MNFYSEQEKDIETRCHVTQTVQEAMDILKKHDLKHTVRYATFSSQKGFGETDFYSKKHVIRWSDNDIPFTGIPFMIANRKLFDWQHGVDRNTNIKEKRMQQKTCTDHHYRQQKVFLQTSKKFNCPATVTLKEIIEFPNQKIDIDTEWRRSRGSKLLKKELRNKSVVTFQRKFLLILPDISMHSAHSVGQHAGLSQEIDHFLVKKIDMLVREGVSAINDMRRHLNITVKHDMFYGVNVPPSSNRRYYPNARTIRSHMVHAKSKMRHSMIDQECLLEKVKQWKEEQPTCSIFYRPTIFVASEENSSDFYEEDFNESDYIEIKLRRNNGGSFLFVYQSAYQRRLLLRYGNEIAFLDATYRTTRYTLPLFFSCS